MKRAKRLTTKFSQLRHRNNSYRLRFTNVPEQFVGPQDFSNIITVGQSGTCRTSLMLAILVNQVRNKRLNNVGQRGAVYVSDFEGYCNLTLFELINGHPPNDYVIPGEISCLVQKAVDDGEDARQVRGEITTRKKQECQLFVQDWFRNQGYQLVIGSFSDLKNRIVSDILRGKVVIHCAEEIDNKFANFSYALLGYPNYLYIATRTITRHEATHSTTIPSQKIYFMSSLVLHCERTRDEAAQLTSFNTKCIRNKPWYSGTERDTMALITELIN